MIFGVDIAGYEGLYTVTEDGDIFSHRHNPPKRLAQSIGSNGYPTVAFHKNGSQKTYPVHRVVAEAFMGARNGRQVNHINANKSDPRLANLEYCSASENRSHSFRIGNESTAKDNSRVRKICESDSLEIRRLWQDGVMQKDIAKMFGITPPAVSMICSGKRW